MKKPAASVPALLELRRSLVSLGKDFWAQEKLAAVDGLIAACLGLHLEAVAEKPAAQPGETLNMQLEAINRSRCRGEVQVGMRLLANAPPENLDAELKFEQLFTKKIPIKLPETLPFSQPYWLRERGTGGTFAVADQTLIGLPENPPPFPVEFTLEIGGQEFGLQHRAAFPESGSRGRRDESAARHRAAGVRRSAAPGVCLRQQRSEDAVCARDRVRRRRSPATSRWRRRRVGRSNRHRSRLSSKERKAKRRSSSKSRQPANMGEATLRAVLRSRFRPAQPRHSAARASNIRTSSRRR